MAIIEYEPLETSGPSIRCPRCRVEQEVQVGDGLRRTGMVDRCPVCGKSEFFVRKDFPQRLGFLIVLFFGGASIYFYRTSVILAWVALAAAVVLDLFIYTITGRVTTCYACRAEFRGGDLNPTHAGFDLATSEKY